MRGLAIALVALPLGLAAQAPPDDAWLSWPASRAQAVGKAAYVRGRVGGWFDTRMLKTESAYNYKLAATWLHPLAVRATVRARQLAERLSDGEAKAMLAAAEKAAGGHTVVMVEIDPREGSGIIPADWAAWLQPAGAGDTAGTPVRGELAPQLRELPAFQGVLRRNYDYDRFWVRFPMAHASGEPVLPRGTSHAELVVRIAGKEGRVKWPLPAGMPVS